MKATMTLALACGLLLATLAAFAAEGDGHKVKVKGEGVLTAKGDGFARIAVLQGTVQLSGSGVLVVSANAEVKITGEQGTRTEKTFEGKGERKGERSVNMVIYTGFNGKATISGERYMISLRGTGIDLLAKGVGRVMLVGEGTYTLNKITGDDEKKGEWTARPKRQPGEERPEFKQPEPIEFGAVERPERAHGEKGNGEGKRQRNK